jgi:peptidoglycan/LPS O-acetylase OafA/YrhL
MQIRSIQILRGVAAIGVVLYHMYIWEGKYLGARAILPSFFSAGLSGVDLFFVISGFIMVFIEPLPIRSYSSYLRFIINRITRIYLPLWIVMLALLPLWRMHPELFNNFYKNHVEIVRSFLLLPQDYTPLLVVAWTLIHEVYFYLIVSFALMFNPRGRWIFGCIWFSMVLLVFVCFGKTGFHNIRVLQLIFSPFSLTFLLGYFIGLLFKQLKDLPAWAGFGLFGMGILTAILSHFIPWPSTVGLIYPDNNSLFRFVACGLPAALLVIGAIALELRLPKPVLQLAWFGNISYAIYLIHLPFLVAFYKVFSKLNLSDPILIGLGSCVCLLTCLLFSAVFHFLIEIKITRESRHLLEKVFKVNQRQIKC